MEESTSKSCSTKSCCFSFIGAIKAGFIAAILIHILMIFQGNNSLLYFGTLFAGSEADPKILYTVGVLVAVIFGIIFAFIYALLIAPIRCIHDLFKAIIFAIILTVGSYYGFPKIPQLASMITKHSVSANPESTAIAVTVPSTTAAGSLAQSNTQKVIITTFTNSLIFAFMVVVLYRRKHCKTTIKTENQVRH